MLPEMRTLKVNRAGMVQCSVIMADGVSRSLAWNAPFLYEHLGRRVDLHFDPLGEWPLEGIVVAHGTRRVLGTAVCQNPFGQSRDADRERVAAIRRTMLTDLRVILGGNAGARRTTGRGIGGTIDIFHRSEADHLADREKNHSADRADRAGCIGAAVPEPRQSTVAVEPPSRRGGDLAADTARTLSRLAAKARDTAPNF
jgi:hypothetical protein